MDLFLLPAMDYAFDFSTIVTAMAPQRKAAHQYSEVDVNSICVVRRLAHHRYDTIYLRLIK